MIDYRILSEMQLHLSNQIDNLNNLQNDRSKLIIEIKNIQKQLGLIREQCIKSFKHPTNDSQLQSIIANYTAMIDKIYRLELSHSLPTNDETCFLYNFFAIFASEL